MPRPLYLGPVGCSKLQEVGVNKVHRVPKTMNFFQKMILDHMECQKKCFWRVLSSWWPVLALLKSQDALKMGCFWDKKWVKNGSKM